ncbi:GNAT family N-acetyltransferase [Nocardia abscessus]|uniref:GNAT family N-acetyltransferase n=1 Tax=Nocardia abscessus TaxID=120957 RepID=UPI002455377A|nr:GNAT family N-acetyltransferase [Nocardia abscessus]
MTEDLRIEVVHDVSGIELPLRGLLEQLDRRHHLRDSSFLQSAHHVSPPTLHLVAVRRGELVGWLAGNPSTGHLALVGVLETRQGVGSALVCDFAGRARRAGAVELTVTVDTEPAGRWDRRRFFISHGFSPVNHSALHFARRLDRTPSW